MKKNPWEHNIKITKNLKFDLEDLMRKVDLNHEFTLRDVVGAIMRSKVPLPLLKMLLHCNYLDEYWSEIKSKKFKDDGKLEYLEIYWLGDRDEFKGEITETNTWAFHGVGPEGIVCDPENFSSEQLEKMKKEHYRQSWAIEFTPMYELANYPIRVSNKMLISDWSKDNNEEVVNFKPSITLIELLYVIFWEISFCGNPSSRNKMKEKLDESAKEIDEAIKNGTIDEITIPFEEFKDELLEKYQAKPTKKET